MLSLDLNLSDSLIRVFTCTYVVTQALTLAVKLADDGVDKGVLWRYMTTSDRHCQ